MRILMPVFILLLFLSCKDKSHSDLTKKELNKQSLKYAKGFNVTSYDTYKVLEITKPWSNAKKKYSYTLTNNKKVENTISTPIKRIVVTSTTHIPALELLGVEHTLVGFPGTDYISSKKTRQRIDDGQIRELGKNESINTEVLLELQPDVVIGFGVDGVNKTFETIKKAGIPVIYNGDWAEASALAKAEWLKFFGVLFNKEKEADSIFNVIETNYLNAKAIAQKAKQQPTILSGALHKDVWYLPNGKSPEAQFLNDANANYLWKDTTGNGSLPLSFESVFNTAKDADLWLSPSYYTSLAQLRAANPLYTNFKPYKSKSIYSFSNTTGETGGVLYYELGTARPDLVLKDIIKICHPELLKNYQPYFFKKLN